MLEYITRTQFSKVEKYFQVKTGRPRIHDLFCIFNAILHILITGSQWRSLPSDYPPYKAVFYHFNRWKHRKVFQIALSALTAKQKPDTLIIDNQSISDTDLPSSAYKGYDGHKKRKGRKRCLLVDTRGNIHCLRYYPANWHDTDCARSILEYYKLTTKSKIQAIKVYGDKGFHSPKLKAWAKKLQIDYQALPRLKKPDLKTKIGMSLWKQQYGYLIDMIKKVRWVVERTFAWLQKYRRLNLNYERTVSSLEAMTLIAGIRMMVRRR